MDHDTPFSRRNFLRASAAVAGAAAIPTLAADQGHAKRDDSKSAVLPRRKLGRTGVDVTILGQGGAFAINTRHLNLCHSLGIRYIDTAKYYLEGASERTIGEWFAKNGHRKEYFLVSKDLPKTPEQLVKSVDERLKALQTDYLDLFFLHAFGDSDYTGLDGAKAWLSDRAWAAAAEKIRKSGKCRFIGFSTHTKPIDVRTAVLNAAAKSGWIDAIMVATNPTVMHDNADFNRSLDACHKAGIGLISMKESYTGKATIKDLFPGFKEKGLSPVTAVMSAMWTDERFATVCSQMDNIKYLRENAEAARNFKPLTDKELAAVDGMLRRAKRTLCVACDGSCQKAAGTQADLNTIARYVTYVRENGQLVDARKLFAAMPPEARDWSGADLEAASRACKCNLDFPNIIAQAEQLLV